MLTALAYLLVAVVVGGLFFVLASLVFGRGEELAPLEPRTTLTTLPATDVTGDDVRALRFAQVVRGYRAGEVDWALDRLAAELDELRAELARHRADPGARPDPAPRPDPAARPDPAPHPVQEDTP